LFILSGNSHLFSPRKNTMIISTEKKYDKFILLLGIKRKQVAHEPPANNRLKLI